MQSDYNKHSMRTDEKWPIVKWLQRKRDGMVIDKYMNTTDFMFTFRQLLTRWKFLLFLHCSVLYTFRINKNKHCSWQTDWLIDVELCFPFSSVTMVTILFSRLRTINNTCSLIVLSVCHICNGNPRRRSFKTDIFAHLLFHRATFIT